MELQTTPDIYEPVLNTVGEYIDYIPNKNILVNGLYCPCSNKNKSYTTSNQFRRHIKTKMHESWLENLNNNKDNLYIENEKNKRLINSQKIIINKLETSINLKDLEINKLLNELSIYKNRYYELDELYTKDQALVMVSKTSNSSLLENNYNVNLLKDNNVNKLDKKYTERENEIIHRYDYTEIPLKEPDTDFDYELNNELSNQLKEASFKKTRFKDKHLKDKELKDKKLKDKKLKDTTVKDTEFKELTYLLDINN